jgi:hypothetical protein
MFLDLPENGSCIERVAFLLVHQLHKPAGKPVNINTLFHSFSFDVMGEIAFDRSFSLLMDPEMASLG